jgi:hypothetical protein
MAKRIPSSVTRDFILHNLGHEMYLLLPQSSKAKRYIAETFDEPDPEHSIIWPILIPEPREIEVIISELYDEGLTFV